VATSTRPGDVLAGRYQLVDLLSESGVGRFWRAHDRVLERYVALHVIAEDDPRAPRLMEAARTSATVLDPRILRVLDAEAREGLCFVVNEWGTGTSLDILVRHVGPLGPRRSAWLVADVAGAVAKAHEAGVAHGRLNPENVLIDRYGAVRLIGLCVDAALHGLPPGRVELDREDLGGLLYCALTATWPGPSGSIVPAAPEDHGHVLPPRRVRAGVPRPLDQMWARITDQPRRRGGEDLDVSSAGAIADRLLEFLGDPTGLPEALAASVPPVNDVQPVVLPWVPDLVPHDLVTIQQGAPAEDELPTPTPADSEPVGPGRTDQPTVRVDLDRPTVQVRAALPATETGDEPDTGAEPEATPPEAPSEVEEGVGENPVVEDDDEERPRVVVDIPTEAGMPVFDDGSDDVSWLRARSSPPPPPPPFEDPPERPLFAPEPPEGAPARRPRTDVPQPRRVPPPASPSTTGGARAGEYWPWDTGTGPHPLVDTGSDHEPVPGRSWLRLGVVLALGLLLLVAIVIAFNLGRGRTPLGEEREDEPSVAATPTPPAPIGGVDAVDFDPFGDADGENPEAVSNVVDASPATTWSTVTYFDQLGPPPGLKTGVGLLLDLGAPHTVNAVDLTLVGAPTDASVFVYETAPTAAPTGTPAAAVTAQEGRTALRLDEPAEGRFVVVWFTSLPAVEGGYRAEVAEVVVRGS